MMTTHTLFKIMKIQNTVDDAVMICVNFNLGLIFESYRDSKKINMFMTI